MKTAVRRPHPKGRPHMASHLVVTRRRRYAAASPLPRSSIGSQVHAGATETGFSTGSWSMRRGVLLLLAALAAAGCSTEEPAAPVDAFRFELATYNVFLRPRGLFDDRQLDRARDIPGAVEGFDAVAFQEVFDDSARGVLLAGVAGAYPYRTRVLGTAAFGREDGGVVLVSRWPIVEEDQLLFGSVCADSDCLADKGVLYAAVDKAGQRYHVFATHLQAGGAARAVREEQLDLLRGFVLDLAVPPGEPVLVVGDLNVDLHDAAAYADLLIRVSADSVRYAGHPFSVDGAENTLVLGDQQELLDHVLPVTGTPWILAENRVFVVGGGGGDLSDHYPVLGAFAWEGPDGAAGAARRSSGAVFR